MIIRSPHHKRGRIFLEESSTDAQRRRRHHHHWRSLAVWISLASLIYSEAFVTTTHSALSRRKGGVTPLQQRREESRQSPLLQGREMSRPFHLIQVQLDPFSSSPSFSPKQSFSFTNINGREDDDDHHEDEPLLNGFVVNTNGQRNGKSQNEDQHDSSTPAFVLMDMTTTPMNRHGHAHPPARRNGLNGAMVRPFDGPVGSDSWSSPSSSSSSSSSSDDIVFSTEPMGFRRNGQTSPAAANGMAADLGGGGPIHGNEMSVVEDEVVPHGSSGGGDLTASVDEALDPPQRFKNNPAMADPNFLRKRTADLLRKTDDAVVSPTLLSKRGMKVERKTFHFLFDAWAFSGQEDAAAQALQLLARMEALGASNPAIQPDVRSYTKVINAVSRAASRNAGQAGEQAERILKKMQNLHKTGKNYSAKPNTFTYTAVMEAHANSGAAGSAERAEELLEVMLAEFKSGDDNVRPTARAFNAAIHAHAKVGQASRAEAIFQKMHHLHKSGGIREAKPKAFNYNALISAWANCPQEGSAAQARRVLDRMKELYEAGDKDVKPTAVSYNAVIDAYAKSGEDGAAEKAEALLRMMSEMSGEEVDARPNTRSFNSVMNAWAKSRREDAAVKAENLLELMSRLNTQGNKEVRPDVHSFCTIINAWARSTNVGKADRAYNLFREMKERYESGSRHLRPNVVAYNAVMNACAFTSGDVKEQSRAVEIAHSVLKEMEKSPHVQPDQVTYGTFLKVCANQMPDSHTRQQIVELLFKKCIKDGQVGNMVLQQLRTMASAELYLQLVGRPLEDEVQMEDLPPTWWCNVVEGKVLRRKRNSS